LQCYLGRLSAAANHRGTRLAQILLCVSGSLMAGSRPSSLPKSFDGVWESRGYGYVLSIKGSLLSEFEVTSTTCVAGFTAQRQSTSPDKWDANFKSKEEGSFFIRGQEGADHAVLHLQDSVPDIQLDRLTRIPAVCNEPTENTPMGNFNVFAQTWAENYIGFDLRHADWNKIIAENRPGINSRTSSAQLFDIFESIIEPLGDLHTYVVAPALKRSTPNFWRSGTSNLVKGKPENLADRGRWKLFAITNRTDLQHSPMMFCRRQLQYGHINNSIGYIRILSFGGYSRRDDLRALEAAMDKIFSDSQLKALVIDVRLSFGGSDELGIAIASRLTDREYLAYTVQARLDPLKRDEWTEGDPIMVRPSARPGFRGPVVELISSITMSGAETFSQALMGRIPHVTRIGENTQGVFCDVLDRHLPNGWTFGLPNAVYRSANGKAFDVAGIPPDIDVPVFTESDIASGKDPAVQKAVQILTEP